VEKIEHGFGEVLISGRIPGRLMADFERFRLSNRGQKKPA
jgi:hypothetical protein